MSQTPDMRQAPDVRLTFGAVLGGAFLSTALSGALSVQAFLYARNYTKDARHLKALVALVWFMDTAQTGCIVMLSYQYVIFNFSRFDIADQIYWTVVAAVVSTALLTFIANGYFAHRVHKLSEGNWWLTVPTAVCLLVRLILAVVTGIQMLRLQSFISFKEKYGPLLTTGLALSLFTDLVITVSLCYYLRTLNRGLGQTRKMLSTIVSFADHNGVLTCVVTLASLICWIAMPSNLVYLGLHFTIGKCYSNSLLATLNMRDYVKRSAGTTLEIVNVTPASLYASSNSSSIPMMNRPLVRAWSEPDDEAQPKTGPSGQSVEIKIDRTVHFA